MVLNSVNSELSSLDSSKPESRQPEIKLHHNLAELINKSAYATNRRPIWETVGVSPAALSQYVLGKARPRLDTLVALAEFFHVSLDYLVLGRDVAQPAREENSAAMRFYELSLTDFQDAVGRRTWITTRVGKMLSD